MTTTPTESNNQDETSILQFDFDNKVYPNVTIKDSADIKFIWSEEENAAVIGFQITVTKSTAAKIEDSIEITAPLLTNVLSSITGIPITYKHPQIKKIRNGQTFSVIFKDFEFRYLKDIGISNIDITKLTSLAHTYPKLIMQLAHIHNGNKAIHNKDYAQAIREYFLIVEYTSDPIETKYENLRHAVSHVRLNGSEAIKDLQRNFKLPIECNKELDNNDPKVKKVLQKHAAEFKKDASLYLNKQLKDILA